MVKRLYVPLPGPEARRQIVRSLMKGEKNVLNEEDVERIVDATDGYSGADMTNLCRDAAIGPIRSIDYSQIGDVSKEDIRPVDANDFAEALKQVKASVSDKDLDLYKDWDSRFGSGK